VSGIIELFLQSTGINRQPPPRARERGMIIWWGLDSRDKMRGKRVYGNHRIVTTRAVTVKVWVLRSIVPRVLSTPVANLVPLTVDGALGVVNSLVMEWQAKLSIVHLRHLRLGAWSSRQIRVSSNRGKVRGPRGEVVLRKWGDAPVDAVSVVLRAMVRLVPGRVE
jgi:hypothetical protein